MTLSFNPPVIGHRGASAYAPENTMSSFLKAAQLGLKWVEFDVMQSKDGIPIIFHDELLDRTTNGYGEVNQYPFAYLQSLDAGKWFDSSFSCERIPSLTTVIDFLYNAKMNANIEIKALPGHEEKLIKSILEEMQPYLNKDNNKFLFSSFSMNALKILRDYSSDCQIGLLLHQWEPKWESICQELNCVSVNVNQEIMTEKQAHRIKSLGKSLLCYTVNDIALAKKLYEWGVDAIFSDMPDKILKK